MENQDLEIIQKRIGYDFNNTDLLQQAFVRKSFSKENGGEDNEILEFIGDKVLDIAIVKFLIDKYGFFCHDCSDFDLENEFDEFCCEKTEGQLTEIKKKLVKKETLSDAIDCLKLNEFLILGKGDVKNKVYNESSIKEDLFESIIGAVTLDCEWDWKEICSTIEYMLEPEKRIQKKNDDNYVELIQEWSLRRYKDLPDIYSYNANYDDDFSLVRRLNEIRSTPKRNFENGLVNVQEYNRTHFNSRLCLQEIDKVFIGCGNSKQEARKDVCELAYKYLADNGLLFSIMDEIENPNKNDAINQLEILARRGYFSIPTYEYKETHDEDGNPIWKCEGNIKEYKKPFYSKSSSKKDAKKTVAFKMLKFVLNGEDK